MMTTATSPADLSSLSPAERWRRALAALARAVEDPERTEDVLEFSTYANAGSSQRRIHRFYATRDGERLYAEHRAIDSQSIDLDALANLPDDTLGHAYAHFLRSRGFTPEVFDEPPNEVADPRTRYAIQRLRQTHDLWHVVTGHDTDPFGEIALQAFTYAQVRAPSSLILALVGTLRGTRERHTLPREVVAAFRAGARAEKLATFPWEDHWATPLAEVRRTLGVEALAA